MSVSLDRMGMMFPAFMAPNAVASKNDFAKIYLLDARTGEPGDLCFRGS